MSPQSRPAALANDELRKIVTSAVRDLLGESRSELIPAITRAVAARDARESHGLLGRRLRSAGGAPRPGVPMGSRGL